MKHTFSVVIFALCSLTLLSATSCGSQNPYGDALTVEVVPNSNLLVGVGPASSCSDEVAYRESLIANAGTSTPSALGASVTGPVIVMNSFRMQWQSTDEMIVQGLRITVTGSGIAGGKVTTDLNQDEIIDLMATLNAEINPSGSTPNGNVTIISDDPTRLNANTGGTNLTIFAPCALAVGSLALTSGTNTQPFTANIVITVLGTALDSNNNARFVEYSTTASAKYYGS